MLSLRDIFFFKSHILKPVIADDVTLSSLHASHFQKKQSVRFLLPAKPWALSGVEFLVLKRAGGWLKKGIEWVRLGLKDDGNGGGGAEINI